MEHKRLRSLGKPHISICQQTKKNFLVVTFVCANEGGEDAVRALLDVNHIASNELCDLAGLGFILYLELTYVWR